jgi:hypothetical protein
MWIIIALQHISPELNVKGFKKCCISYPNVLAETDVGMLWKGSSEVGNVRSKCEKDEGTDCEDGER